MFKEIQLKNLAQSKLFGYAAKLPYFAGKKSIEFTPGLNILFGPNGCGKSTVLNMLADTMAARQGGTSHVTQDYIRQTVDSYEKDPAKQDSIGIKCIHDGQPVVFADTRNTVGLIGGSFDDDFFDKGLAEVMTKNVSHGQRSMSRLNSALETLVTPEKFPKSVVYKVSRKTVNSTWQAALDIVDSRMKGSIEPGPRTLLLDEPESNFSLVWQARLWKLLALKAEAENFQVIVATHSPFALKIPTANYVDLDALYRVEAELLLTAKFTHFAEPTQ